MFALTEVVKRITSFSRNLTHDVHLNILDAYLFDLAPLHSCSNISLALSRWVSVDRKRRIFHIFSRYLLCIIPIYICSAHMLSLKCERHTIPIPLTTVGERNGKVIWDFPNNKSAGNFHWENFQFIISTLKRRWLRGEKQLLLLHEENYI